MELSKSAQVLHDLDVAFWRYVRELIDKEAKKLSNELKVCEEQKG